MRSRGKVGSGVYIAVWPVYYASSASGRILARILTRGIRVRVLEGMGASEQIVEGAPLDSRVRGLELKTGIQVPREPYCRASPYTATCKSSAMHYAVDHIMLVWPWPDELEITAL